MKAYKMACLHYKPSEVAFRGKLFTRQTLMRTIREMLEQEWEEVLERKPFNTTVIREYYNQVSDSGVTAAPESTLDAFYRIFEAKLDKVKS